MLRHAHELTESIVHLRRELHRHPELGFEEQWTANLVADRLAALGIDVRTGVGKTGVVGDLGQSGPRIALRADMDALPIQEENEVDYASENPGVMHACGHDVHVACLLGAAELLTGEAQAGRLQGQVRFLFQPAEEAQDSEGLSGAMRMVDEGVMEGVDAVVGLHVWADLPVGAMSLREGASSAFTDSFELAITGRESHGAFPHHGVDAIAISAQVINALQSLVSRRLDPTKAKVLSVGTIRGGTKENIIAGRVTMTGTIRTFDQDTRQDLFSELERAASVAKALGGNYELSVKPGYTPVVNDPALTSFVRQVGTDLLGEDNVHESPLEMGGEDFSCFAEKAPGCFFILGAELPGDPKRLHHHPRFDVDEQCLPVGAALLAETATRFLRQASQ